jgi:hypothetical protein
VLPAAGHIDYVYQSNPKPTSIPTPTLASRLQLRTVGQNGVDSGDAIAGSTRDPPLAAVIGTPTNQKEAYGIPLKLVGTNKTNLQEVWGCGTFGVNKTELGMFYSKSVRDFTLFHILFGQL